MNGGYSPNRILALGLVTAWGGRLVGIILNFLFLRLILSRLGEAESALWILLGQTGFVFALLDFGFGQAFARQFAALFASLRQGGNTEATGSLADWVATARTAFVGVAGVGTVLCFALGMLFVSAVPLTPGQRSSLILAYGIYCVGNGIGIALGSSWALLAGSGRIAAAGLFQTLANVLTIGVQCIIVQLGGGIIALAAGTVSAALVLRQIALSYSRRALASGFEIRGGAFSSQMLRQLWSLAFRGWIVNLSSFFILRIDQFFVAALVGVASVPVYQAAFTLFGNLLWFSCALSGTSYTVISQLWQAGNMDALRVVVRRNLLMSLFAVAIGGSWICAEGHAIVSIWLGEQYFAGHALFLVIWLGMIIQSAQDAALVACRAAGLEFFAVSSVCCAALNLLLSSLLGVRFGLLGIALATIIAQLVTNGWYSMIILKSHLGFHFDAALLRAGLSMLVAASISFLLSKLLGLAFPSSWIVSPLLLSLAACGILFAICLWWVVLSVSDRHQILRAMRRIRLPRCTSLAVK